MSTCADVGSFIGSKTSVVQTSNVGFTSEVSDYLVVHTGHDSPQSIVSYHSFPDRSFVLSDIIAVYGLDYYLGFLDEACFCRL